MIEVKRFNMKHYENESIDNIEGEVWKDVIGYEGIYKISNLGRVKTLERIYFSGLNHKLRKVQKEKILKLSLVCGYPSLTLNKNTELKFNSVHRLVAIHFIDNPHNLPCINHKNGIRDDLRIENLEWCTYTENAKHSFRELGRTQKSGMTDELSKPFIGINVLTGEKRNFGSQREAARELKSYQCNIFRALHKGNVHKGYKFEFEK